MSNLTPKSAARQLPLPYTRRRDIKTDEDEDDDDSGCMLDEYGWASADTTIHGYFAGGPLDNRLSYINSADERWRAARLTRQLPPQDADPARCQALADGGETAQLRAFAAARRRHCLGRGIVVAPPAVSEKVYCHQCKEAISSDDITVAAPVHFDASATAVGSPHHGAFSLNENSQSNSAVRWHARCFVCVECREQLVDLIYFHHGQNVFCGRHHAELLKPRCAACDELIFSEECAETEGRAWHLAHFGCVACGRPLAGQRYVTTPRGGINDAPFCLSCHERASAVQSADVETACATCARPLQIDRPHIAQGSLNWHADARCFACSACGESLLGHQYSLAADGRLFCKIGVACGRQPTPPRLPPPPPPPQTDANNNKRKPEEAENIYETVMTGPAAATFRTGTQIVNRLQTFGGSPSAASASSAYSSQASGASGARTEGGTSSSPSAASASSLQRRRLEMEARQRVIRHADILTRRTPCLSSLVPCRSEVCFGAVRTAAERRCRSMRSLVGSAPTQPAMEASQRRRQLRRRDPPDESTSASSTTSADEMDGTDGALDEYLSKLALAMRLVRPADPVSRPKKAHSVDSRRHRHKSAGIESKRSGDRDRLHDWRRAAFVRLHVHRAAKAPSADIPRRLINVYSEMPPEEAQPRQPRRHKHRRSHRHRYASPTTSATTSDASDVDDDKRDGNNTIGARSCVEFTTRAPPPPPSVPPLQLWPLAKIHPSPGCSSFHRSAVVGSRSSQDLTHSYRQRRPLPPAPSTGGPKFATARLTRAKASSDLKNCIVS